MPAERQPKVSSWRSVFRPDLFQGKVALVTGGGSGIGRTIATELAVAGADRVVIASRDRSKCHETAVAINQQVERDVVVAGPSTSIRDAEQVEALIQFILEQYGRLDLLVNNAGGQFISPAEDLSKRGMSAVVDTNLVGTFLVCQQAYTQYMRDATEPCAIVNITLGNRNGMPGMLHSGAARAGVENMTATLCTEWIESGVRINCVRPGIIWTDSGFANYGPAGEAFAAKILPSIPAKRFGSPEEVSSAVVWLLSEGARYVTGTVVCVDGGSSYTLLPLMDISDTTHLAPYGTLPDRAML